MNQTSADYFVQMELCDLDLMHVSVHVNQTDADSELSESECIDHPDIVPLGVSHSVVTIILIIRLNY